MYSELIEFRGFDPQRLDNLARLLRGNRARSAPPAPILLVQRDAGYIVKALHTRKGRIDPKDIDINATAQELAHQLGARLAIIIEREALEALHESASREFRVGQDLVELGLALLRGLDEEKRAGRISLWPDVFEGIRPPNRATLNRVLDTVLPQNNSILLYIFKENELYAELICARGAREIVLLGGHDVLRMGSPPRQWRRDYRELLQAAEKEVNEPSLGVFVTLETALSFLRGKPRVDVSRALARKDLIIDPLPLWLAGPLGIAAVKNVVDAGKRAREHLVEKVKPKGVTGRIAGRLANAVAGRMKSTLEDGLRRTGALERVESRMDRLKKRTDLTEILGFDPFLLAAKIMKILRDR